VAVLKRMVLDLDLPVRIDVIPTVREPDGLAMSSRNVRLSAAERERAVALSQGLAAARDAIGGGERDPRALRAAATRAMSSHAVEPEYVALVDPDSFQPIDTVNGRVLVAVAARLGEIRLIDNALIETT
jgi:pantoate--beta-alanine ligase